MTKANKSKTSSGISPIISPTFNDEAYFYNPFDLNLKYDYYVKKSPANEGFIYCFEKNENQRCIFKLYFREHVPSGALLLLENITDLSRQTVLDLGSGTGIISVFAGIRNAQKAIAIDIEPNWIEIAKYNSNLNHLDKCVKIHEGDMFDPIEGCKFDKIITNPPQMPTPKNNYNIQDYGGAIGSDFIDRLINTAYNYLTPRGEIWIFLMEFLGTNTRYGDHPTIFEKLRDNGFKPEIVTSASRIVRRGGVTEKMIPYILSIYPLYDFYDDLGNHYNDPTIIKNKLKDRTKIFCGVKVLKCMLK